MTVISLISLVSQNLSWQPSTIIAAVSQGLLFIRFNRNVLIVLLTSRLALCSCETDEKKILLTVFVLVACKYLSD